ncbi:TcpQ domain-containing protein [Hydrogenophaga sp. MI9]|uniref:TcpQ domain-containing protein n=1 Tax=Hydrogenophaga sp. MI9 TaxID=3453719 RepID=UPI003EF07CF6
MCQALCVKCEDIDRESSSNINMYPQEMKKHSIHLWRAGTGLVLIALLQACAAPKATDISDNWKPVNSLAAKPQEIPLKEEAELPKFQMLPTDATLRHMLERWAKENGGALDWQYPSDLTLVTGLDSIKDSNLQRALNSVRKTYAAQKLRIQVSANKTMLVTKMP